MAVLVLASTMANKQSLGKKKVVIGSAIGSTDSDLQVQKEDVRNGMDSEMRSVEIRYDGLRVENNCGVQRSLCVVILAHQVDWQ